jgi:hypothetical protein
MRPQNEVAIFVMLGVALLLLVLFIAFATARLFKRTRTAVGACAAIVFALFYLFILYVGHAVSGLSIWHIVAIAGLGAVITWIFRQERKF